MSDLGIDPVTVLNDRHRAILDELAQLHIELRAVIAKAKQLQLEVSELDLRRQEHAAVLRMIAGAEQAAKRAAAATDGKPAAKPKRTRS